MKYKVIKTEFDEFYRQDELITHKTETIEYENGSFATRVYERIEKEALACGCSGVDEKVMTITQPYTLIKESSLD